MAATLETSIPLKDRILGALEAVAADQPEADHVWVQPYVAPRHPDEDGARAAHHFVVFVKPEATWHSAGVRVSAVLDLILGALEAHDVRIGAVRVLGGPYLEREQIMSRHYGVIADISKNGKAVLSEEVRQKLRRLAAEFGAPEDNVLGGHEFLVRFPQHTALSLGALNDWLGSERLAPGTYATRLSLAGGDRYVVLNAFHAQQLIPYTQPGRAIVALECSSARPWAELRNRVCGQTDPAAADRQSIRGLLLRDFAQLGLPDCHRGANGVHTSAGPLEGLVELQRFFGDRVSSGNPHGNNNSEPGWHQFMFGRQLRAAGLDDRQITGLAANPVLHIGGRLQSAFDATEEMDAAEAAQVLAQAAAAPVLKSLL